MKDKEFYKGLLTMYLEYLNTEEKWICRSAGAGMSETEMEELEKIQEGFVKKLTAFNKKVNKRGD